MTTEIADTIRDFLKKRFDISEGDPAFDHDTHLFDYGYVDSFGAVELTEFVERTFGIEVRDSDFVVHPLNTVNEIASFVAGRRSGSV